MNGNDDVLFDELPGYEGNIGVITLNRPQVLNSLNHSMIHAMHTQLQLWARAFNIKAVIIRAAEGRAFCAGGDLSMIHERANQADQTLQTQFFRDEYHLNSFIFHYPKPYIALLDGITMGGGVGISVHGSHRVATERLTFAMPETGIGFFPDVGGTYFLPRLPGFMGFYLGLTGARLKSDDCVALGIAQYKVAEKQLMDLVKAIQSERFGKKPHVTVTEILEQFQQPFNASELLKQQSDIDECFSGMTMEEILKKLKNTNQIICTDAADMIVKKSPTSLKVTLRALQEGKHLDFDACMRQEFRLTNRFLEGYDFKEGIRAVIIDKDQAPKWQPNKLEEVSDAVVKHYFSKLKEEISC